MNIIRNIKKDPFQLLIDINKIFILIAGLIFINFIHTFSESILDYIILTVFTILAVFIPLFLHELVHYVTAIILGINAIEICTLGISISVPNKKIFIRGYRPGYEGMVFIKNIKITDHSELRRYQIKCAIMGISAPIFSAICAIALYYIINNYELADVYSEYLYLIFAINFAAVISGLFIGDIKVAISHLINKDFAYYILTETDIYSDSYHDSLAKEYLNKTAQVSVNKLMSEDINFKKEKDKLRVYKYILRLFLAGEKIDINEDLFFHVINNKEKLNYRSNDSKEIIFYSIIYLYVYHKNMELCEELYQYLLKKLNLSNKPHRLINETLKYFLYGSDNYNYLMEESDKMLGSNVYLTKNIVNLKKSLQENN